MHLPQPTLLGKGRVLEVISLNHKIRRDVVADHLQPVPLFIRELPSFFLLPQPNRKVGVDLFRKWHQLILLMGGKANEGDQVGQNTLAARAFDLRLLQCGLVLPELGFIPEVGRLFDGVGQILDVLKREPLLVWPAVEDL